MQAQGKDAHKLLARHQLTLAAAYTVAAAVVMSHPLSWERTASGHSASADDLLVFGYSARLFRDDEQASLVDSGRHLVPCQDRDEVRIDRSVHCGCRRSRPFPPNLSLAS